MSNQETRITTQTAHFQNVANLQQIKKCDKSYTQEWNRFCKWVDVQRSSNGTELSSTGTKYLTRENIDRYFTIQVIKRRINGDSARRIVSALNWYAKHHEYSATRGQDFVVDSAMVQTTIDLLRERSYSRTQHARNFKKIDPHDDVPDSYIPTTKWMQMMDVAIQKINYADLIVALATTKGTLMRNANILNYTLSRYMVVEAFSPNALRDDPTDERCALQIIIRAEDMLKAGDKRQADKNKKTTYVAAVRHKHWKLCLIGMNAVAMLMQLHDDNELNFMNKDWQDRNIIGWTNYVSSYEQMKSVLNEVVIDYGKVTHFRKAGCAEAYRFGVQKDAIASMSKHKVDVLDKYYFDPVSVKMVKFCAGFDEHEYYYVPRETIGIPVESQERLTELFFPKINQWRDESNSVWGDHGRAAHNFLYKVLPYFATTLAQDGIYWLKDYPQHPVSQKIRMCMPITLDYELWAKNKIKEVKHKELNKDRTIANIMGPISRAAFQANNEKLNLILESNNQVIQKIQGVQSKLQRIDERLLKMEQTFNQDQDSTSSTVHTTTNTPAHQQQTIIAATQQLRHEPQMPTFSTTLPNTMFRLYLEHQQQQLSRLNETDKRHWKQNIKVAFSRRKYLYDKILKRAKHSSFPQNLSNDERNRNAAKQFDRERGLRTITKYLTFLKSEDPNTKKRRRNFNGI